MIRIRTFQRILAIALGLGFAGHSAMSADTWPQAAGPNADWKAQGKAPIQWSIVQDQNIAWRTSLPEGGQSSITIWEDKVFVTTHAPLDSTDQTSTVTDIVGYCLDGTNGKILWTVDLPGSAPVGTAGIFSDATVFAPVTDGIHVWFFNRSGSIGCFDMTGQQVWLREYVPRNRHTNRQAEPILVGNQILVVEVLDKAAAQKLKRHAPIPAEIDPKSVWTYLHGLDAATGETLWVEPTGTVIHNSPTVGQTASGKWAVLHIRGGPHAPLETPYGLTLTSLAPGREGETIWFTEIQNINPMFNANWDAEHAYAMAGEYHLTLDTETGREVSRHHLRQNVDHWRHDPETNSHQLERGVVLPGNKPRLNTYHTNIVIGDWHYFLAHEHAAIGRVHLRSEKVEYLDVPLQLAVNPDGTRTEIWDAQQTIPIIPQNSRGVNLMQDKRSAGTGWGHVSAASPILVGHHLYFPVLSGTVYVIDTEAPEFSSEALVAINDLGAAGETWTLSSLAYADQKLYTRTLTEVMCIEE